MRKMLLLVLSLFIIGSSCSVQRMAIRSMGDILDNTMKTLFEEEDLELAEHSISSNLKLLEALIKSDPKNEKLLLMASQGFASYSLGFVEDREPERARRLYLRGKEYGMRQLKRNRDFEKAFTGNPAVFENALQSFNTKDVPFLFWTAYNWAGMINLSMTNPQAIADLPRVQSMMQRVIELDESYFFGGAHLFFATIYSIRPPILGGNIEKADMHFQSCFKYANDQFLLPYVYYARYYATRIMDRELFENTLDKVINTPYDILQDQTLPNKIAQEKAKRIYKKTDQLF